MDQTAVVTLSCPWTEGTEAKKGDLGDKWWRVESAGVKARGKDKRCTLDKAAWMLPETGSWRTSPVLWLDFPWVAGGRLQVDPSTPPPLPPYSPCRTSPCYHGNTGRAVPWDRGMQTEERSTLPFPQSTGRREPPPTPPNMEMDQRSQNPVAFNSVLHLHCWWGIEHLLFCVCMCFYKILPALQHKLKWFSCYPFLYSTCPTPVCFILLPDNKKSSLTPSSKKVGNQKPFHLQLGMVFAGMFIFKPPAAYGFCEHMNETNWTSKNKPCLQIR